jgi:hypothetical protein
MALSGTINADTWTVGAETVPAPQGGYGCRIRVSHTSPTTQFSRECAHHCTFENEATAVLEGLREGVTWVELKTRHAFHV